MRVWVESNARTPLASASPPALRATTPTGPRRHAARRHLQSHRQGAKRPARVVRCWVKSRNGCPHPHTWIDPYELLTARQAPPRPSPAHSTTTLTTLEPFGSADIPRLPRLCRRRRHRRYPPGLNEICGAIRHLKRFGAPIFAPPKRSLRSDLCRGSNSFVHLILNN